MLETIKKKVKEVATKVGNKLLTPSGLLIYTAVVVIVVSVVVANGV